MNKVHQPQSLDSKRVAIIKPCDQHLATIGRQQFESIADDLLYVDAQGKPRLPALTLRELVEPDGPKQSRRRRVRFQIGLLERVTRMLQARGWKVRVRPRNAPEHLYDHWHPEERHCPEFLRRAYDRPYTLGIVPKYRDRLWYVSELCKQFPESNVLVVANNIAQAAEAANALRELTDRGVTSGSEWWHSEPPFIHVDVVGTITGRSVIDWRFVIVLDAELLSLTVTSQLVQMFGSILIGFLGRDERQLNERDRAQIEDLFGPVVYRSGDEIDYTSVTVAWLAAPTYPAIQPASPLERKRMFFWQNAARNRLIAHAAQAIRQNDQQMLRRLVLDKPAAALMQTVNKSGPKVAIVVESVEHGRELCRLLPDWPLRYAGDNPDAPDDLFINSSAIVTLAMTERSPLLVDVVIYAAGTGDRWRDDLGLQCVCMSEERMLVIDIADDGDQQAVASVHARAADYRHSGWKLMDEPFVQRLSLPTPPAPSLDRW
jgi:hypothetical protein